MASEHTAVAYEVVTTSPCSSPTVITPVTSGVQFAVFRSETATFNRIPASSDVRSDHPDAAPMHLGSAICNARSDCTLGQFSELTRQ